MIAPFFLFLLGVFVVFNTFPIFKEPKTSFQTKIRFFTFSVTIPKHEDWRQHREKSGSGLLIRLNFISQFIVFVDTYVFYLILQARLPELRSQPISEKRPEKCEDWEEPRWVPPISAPGVRDGDLIVYIQAARSVAAFVGMCDGGSPDDGCLAASRDDTTINALDVVSNYFTDFFHFQIQTNHHVHIY